MNKGKPTTHPPKKPKPKPQYSMRQPRRFEKGDFCPECQKGLVSGDPQGNIFCKEQGCGFSAHISEITTTDYAQINYKLMAILYRGGR